MPFGPDKRPKVKPGGVARKLSTEWTAYAEAGGGAIYEDSEGNWLPVPRPTPFHATIRGMILNALAYTEGNQRHAAHLLQISARVLNYQMSVYQIPSSLKGKGSGGRRRKHIGAIR